MLQHSQSGDRVVDEAIILAFSSMFSLCDDLPQSSCLSGLNIGKQLLHGFLSMQDAYSSSGQPAPVSLPSGLLLAATRQWMFSNRRSPGGRRSTLHSAVVMTLKEGLGLKVDQEVLTDDGLFSIDAAVIWKGR